jgi:hypothetical protein
LLALKNLMNPIRPAALFFGRFQNVFSGLGRVPASVRRLVVLGAALGSWPAVLPAQFVVYNDRATFTAAAPGLPVEDFEEASRAFNGITGTFGVMSAPLDRFTNNFFFSPGEILDGLRITDGTLSGVIVPNIAVGSPGFRNNTSHAISYALGGTSLPQLTLSFYNQNVTAFGLDLTTALGSHDLSLTLFSGASNVGSYVLQNVGAGGVFFGITSAAQVITSVRLSTAFDYFSLDNVAFGAPATNPGVSAVPEPAAYGMIAVAMLAGAIGWRRRRRCVP